MMYALETRSADRVIRESADLCCSEHDDEGRRGTRGYSG